MGEKRILIVLGILNLAVLGVLGGLYLRKDSVPPVITIEKDGFVYREGMKPEELLAGVSAADPEEGDVSSSLVVEKVVLNAEKRTALITYGAMDSKGNMSKASCRAGLFAEEAAEHPSEMLPVAGEAGDMEAAAEEETEAETGEEQTGGEAAGEPAGNEAAEAAPAEPPRTEPQPEPAEPPAPAPQPESAEPPAQAPPAPQPQAAGGEAPSLRFGKTEITTVKGQDPAWVNFIGELQDNKDNYEYLLNHLKIDGNYDRNKEGTYSVRVSTVDSDGNESKAASVTITVQ